MISLRAVPSSEMPVYLARFDAYIQEIAPSITMPPWPEWWDAKNHVALWIETEQDIVGIALIRRLRENETDLSEFTIFPEHRRAGHGVEAARKILNSFGTRWSIAVISRPSSLAFWKQVVNHPDYTFVEREPMNELQTLTYIVTRQGHTDG